MINKLINFKDKRGISSMETSVQSKPIGLIVCFCVATFLGAFLLFQIEPIVGKLVTPRYGGTASVWTICLLFFQVVVLAGYATTFVITKLPPKVQLALYLCIMGTSLVWAQIPTGPSWQHGGSDEPVISLLIALATRVAIPCILLSTVSGVMQVWFGFARLGNPYPLYSVSNIGSIVALLAYPTLIEPNLTVVTTLKVWSYIYWLLAACALSCAAIAWSRLRGNESLAQAEAEAEHVKPEQEKTPISFKDFAIWTFFSTMGSATLLSYTSYITSEVSPTPLLWVLPLAAYLLTFVLVFGDLRFYRRLLFLNSWMIICALEPTCTQISYLLGLAINLLLVFEICMICHGELASRKPGLAHLPGFYLAVAIGGSLGGILIGVVAPAVLNFEAERIIVIAILGLFTVYELALKKFLAQGRGKALAVFVAILVGVAAFAWFKLMPQELVYRERNFYSAARVVKEGDYLVFYHGKINHGQQFLDPAKYDQPAGPYWMPISLIMAFLHAYHNNAPLKIGDVGLGVGVMAAYGRPVDTITFFELDPKVERIAQRFFTYLSRSKAKIDIQLGDGRAVLNGLACQNYDLLLVDAFNGDAIPCHLLTREAALIYLKHLKQDGLLVFHITNRYVGLAPVLGNLAQEMHMSSCHIRFVDAIDYVILSRDADEISKFQQFFVEHKKQFPYVEVNKTPVRPGMGVWTDDFANLWSVLRLHT
jgi:hypothetical protein